MKYAPIKNTIKVTKKNSMNISAKNTAAKNTIIKFMQNTNKNSKTTPLTKNSRKKNTRTKFPQKLNIPIRIHKNAMQNI